MIEPIKNLLAYQNADLAVDAVEKQVRSSKERKTANAMKQRYELAVEERKKLIAQRDQAEKKMEQIAGEVAKLNQLAQVDRAQNAPEDADALKTLIDEINKMMAALKKAEEKIHALDQLVTENEQKINEYGVAATRARDEFNANKAEYEKQLEAARPEIEKIRAERDKLEKKQDPALLKKYQTLKKNKIVPMAPMTDNRCGGCHMGMPAFTVSNAQKNGYCECENCGRIVYIE
ncbi:MAG: hypothetical protein J6X30_03795 [Clostridia bacterium]|nr:hypothetical protein [Clostridia bacterium]